MQNLYSIDELAEKTGFSPRTIAYYIQMKLLPSIGRRGRKTKYPIEYLYRLQVIKRFKDKQSDNYLLMQYGLEDVAALLNCMTPEELKEFAAGKMRISEHTLQKILLKSGPEDKKYYHMYDKIPPQENNIHFWGWSFGREDVFLSITSFLFHHTFIFFCIHFLFSRFSRSRSSLNAPI